MTLESQYKEMKKNLQQIHGSLNEMLETTKQMDKTFDDIKKLLKEIKEND